MIRSLLKKALYNPYRFAKRCPYVAVGNSRLSRSFQVEFRTPRSAVSFAAGDDCILMCKAVFESAAGSISIGQRVFINEGTQLISRSRIDIEDDVTIAWGCTLYDHDSHSLDARDRNADQQQQLQDWDSGDFIGNKDWSKVATAPIRIRRNAWIGFDVVILKGVTIGEGAVIGARSVVTKDIPAWSVAVGNPARVVKQIPPHQRNDHAQV